MRRCLLAALLAAPLVSATASANEPAPPPPKLEANGNGETMIVHEGEASYYGPGFEGRRTANGERFSSQKATAASRELPLGTRAKVINQENGRSVEVTINDRGPYADGRVIDLSKSTARKLGMIEDGTAPVRIEASPSDQPTATAREKVEQKAEELAEGG